MTLDDIDRALVELQRRIIKLSAEYLKFIRINVRWWRFERDAPWL